MMNKICKTCGNPVIRKPTDTRWKIRQYCSQICSGKSSKGRTFKMPESAIIKLRDRHGSKNPNWKGDEVGLGALHEWVTSRFPRTKLCNHCKKKPPLDLSNISNQYKRALSDWEWLCRRCHMLSDGRMNNLKQFQKK